jgi:anaerobic glycerol-3-phosphate dehydrogenase
MHAPLEPHYSFTIPSIHDDTTLDCRIYHPDVFDEPLENAPRRSPWRKRGVVMAHPYAPMGGSYDDRIVGVVVDELLKAGYIIGTFNFRYRYMAHHGLNSY